MKMKNRENAFLKYWPWLLPAGAVKWKNWKKPLIN